MFVGQEEPQKPTNLLYAKMPFDSMKGRLANIN
jgi:hypothetical protein